MDCIDSRRKGVELQSIRSKSVSCFRMSHFFLNVLFWDQRTRARARARKRPGRRRRMQVYYRLSWCMVPRIGLVWWNRWNLLESLCFERKMTMRSDGWTIWIRQSNDMNTGAMSRIRCFLRIRRNLERIGKKSQSWSQDVHRSNVVIVGIIF